MGASGVIDRMYRDFLINGLRRISFVCINMRRMFMEDIMTWRENEFSQPAKDKSLSPKSGLEMIILILIIIIIIYICISPDFTLAYDTWVSCHMLSRT